MPIRKQGGPGSPADGDTEKWPPDGRRDVPTWTNVLVTDDMPIRWTTEPGEPWPGDELAGRLVIGHEEQLVIDMCGTAVTKLLAVLVAAHHGTDALPLTISDEHQRGSDQRDA